MHSIYNRHNYNDHLINVYAVLSCSVLSNSFVTSWTVAHQAPLSMEFSRQKHWIDSLLFPQKGIFLTQGSNPGLLHYRQILYCLSHRVSPSSSLTRDQTPSSLHHERGVLATGPPGKSLVFQYFRYQFICVTPVRYKI